MGGQKFKTVGLCGTGMSHSSLVFTTMTGPFGKFCHYLRSRSRTKDYAFYVTLYSRSYYCGGSF